ncbi:hypothetical protein GCM10022220_02620 [Actinocatenispora rupis]|uniref:Uncharacterized protein n=2 Tax=Actinocatenispora rupis TaxID=519421 RepID=A0A8J3JGA5_9ACTN|nr:hypothetical protein Aru02nite_52170 [Actinocatenispora rupis]
MQPDKSRAATRHRGAPGTVRRMVAASVAVVGAAGITAAALPAAATATPPRPTLNTGHTTRVTLPTGDKLLVTRDASGRVRGATPATRTHQTFLTEHLGKDTYVLPGTALAKLGKGMSLAQFDVTALAAGRTGVNPGGVHPNFPMRTATITVLDAQGKPADDAGLAVVNVDDSRKYANFPEAVNGQARISVPDGHYALMAYHATYDAAGTSVTGEWISFGRFTVSGKAVTSTVDMRKATSELSIGTPKPADTQAVDLTWARGSSDDAGLSSGVSTDASHPVHVSSSPSGPGVQHWDVHATLTSPKGTAEPYQYEAEFATDRAVGTNQRYAVTEDSVATIDTRYYADKPRTGQSVWFSALPWEFLVFRAGVEQPQPERRTVYLSADDPDLTYSSMVVARFAEGDFYGEMDSGVRTFSPGQQARIDWMRGPLAPGIPGDTGVGDYYCGACRQSDTMSIGLAPVTDSTADHSGYLDPPGDGTVSSSHFVLYRGSAKLADEKDVVGGDFPVPAARSSYRIAYDQTRRAPWTAQSTTSHTEWTFSSTHSGTAGVPGRFVCADGTTAKCSPVNLLLPRYAVDQTLDGRVPVGASSLVLTVTHAAGNPRTPIEGATVAVSYDDGKNWTKASVQDLGGGRYSAGWDNPASAAGHTVTLKVTATDSTHATVTQIVHAAVTVAAQ